MNVYRCTKCFKKSYSSASLEHLYDTSCECGGEVIYDKQWKFGAGLTWAGIFLLMPTVSSNLPHLWMLLLSLFCCGMMWLGGEIGHFVLKKNRPDAATSLGRNG